MPPSFAPSCSIWPFSGLRSRSAGRRSPSAAAARRAALELLAEAEESLGASVVLQRERQSYAAGLSGKPIASAAPGDKAPETVWEHYALGRYLLRGGELDAAENEFQQALDQAPEAFWPNYYAGMCAFRQGRYQQALNVFYACVALAPQTAQLFLQPGIGPRCARATASRPRRSAPGPQTSARPRRLPRFAPATAISVATPRSGIGGNSVPHRTLTEFSPIVVPRTALMQEVQLVCSPSLCLTRMAKKWGQKDKDRKRVS